MHKPSRQLYDTLQFAYAHYNKALFQNQLPYCMITLNNKGKNSYGYYVRNKFASNKSSGKLTDEICLNPVHFESKNFQEVMQTLVHEMVHLWQFNFGEKPSRAYHDKQFAAKMFEVGLQPTANGKPDGATTGPSMLDICIPGGPFDKATMALTALGISLDWYDRSYALFATPTDSPLPLFGQPATVPATDQGKKPTSKQKYSCPDGHLNAWAKPGAKLLCGDCLKQMRPK